MPGHFSHVGVLVHSIDDTIPLWRDLFRMSVIKRLDVPQEGVKSAFMSVNGSPDGFLVELVEPEDPEDMTNIVSRRLRERGEGLLHLAFIEGDIASMQSRVVERQISFAAREEVTDGGGDRLILSPKHTSGVMLEVLSALEWSNVWSHNNDAEVVS